MRGKACCITGHREISAEQTELVKQTLRQEIEEAIQAGFTHFISGFAEGTYLFFAEIVTEFCQEKEYLTLEGAIPTRSRFLRLQKGEETKHLLDACIDISIISETYQPNVYEKRNQYMVDQAERLIAVYDGRETGRTPQTVRMAQKKGIQIRMISV